MFGVAEGVTHRLKNLARTMRKNMTPQEVKLWVHLKTFKKQGCHFRRQVPFQGYIIDFICYTSKLVIEIDGGQHNNEDHQKRDAFRDKELNTEGFTVLRFWNTEIDQNMEGVLTRITEHLTTTPPPPRRGTSPI